MPQPDDVIPRRMEKIRELINNPRKHYELRQNKALFSQLVSSLDTIEDSEQAIAAFIASEFGESKAALYLAIYGLLQAFFVQQDAVIHLCESLGIKEGIDNYPKLKEVREIRNDSIGHPTKRDQKKGQPTSYHHISQITMTRAGFQMGSFFSDGRYQHKDIHIPGLIGDQREYVAEILDALIEKLDTEEKTHKAKFRMEKLLAIFPDSIGYHCDKIVESVLKQDTLPGFGAANLEEIRDAVRAFREAVGRRDRDFCESLEDDYALIYHAISNLEHFFQARDKGEEPKVEIATARIFSTFLRGQVQLLKTYANQIDDEYAE
jgi:hypothetical protein